MRLNPSQATVAAARERRLLVLAGAGTGKTATSVHWVAGLVREGIPRSRILMLTFTRKAAAEMARRVEALVRQIPRAHAHDALTVGTYHAVAIQIMRRDPDRFGLRDRNFSTIDESEAHSIWKSALKQCGADPKAKGLAPQTLHPLYSLARNTRVPLPDLLHSRSPDDAAFIERVVRTYEALKRAANVVDYDDLLTRWEQAMAEHPDYAGALRERWHYVLVDEMQDNNQMNQAILERLDPLHLMVVGDLNQSIYGFRGSDVRLIAEFTQRHPDARTLKLEDNYRSAQTILDLANAVVAGTPSALHLQSARAHDGRLRGRIFLNPVHEARGLVEWFKERVTMGAKPRECAVLARSSKTLAAAEAALSAARIRYRKYGGLTLADSSEVKDFIAFLRLVHNPNDKIALLRALTQFPGIGEGTAERVIQGHASDTLFSETFWPQPAADLPVWLKELGAAASLGEQGTYLAERVQPIIEHNYPSDSGERMATLQTLVASMQDSTQSLEEFLDGFALERTTSDYHPDDCVIVSTIHSAKGLEWDGVWLLGAGSLQMPHQRAVEEGNFEEERRLFYVAITRARSELVLSYPSQMDRGGTQGPTPFAAEHVTWEDSLIAAADRSEADGSGRLVAMFKALASDPAG